MTPEQKAAAEAVSVLFLEESDGPIHEACYRFLCAMAPAILDDLEAKLELEGEAP